MENEVLNCPFCGYKVEVSMRDVKIYSPNEGSGRWKVYCVMSECFIRPLTPECSSIERAIKIWNMRK